MVTRKELLHGKTEASLTPEQSRNLSKLYIGVNKYRESVGLVMIVTNCVRTWLEHLAIYAKKGITDLKLIPSKSKHLIGAACDFADSDGKLGAACNDTVLEFCGLWAEDPKYTKGWLHLQSEPYPSWKPGMTRMYRPS